MGERSVAGTSIDPAKVREVTRLDLAVTRGLLLDLLVTGDEEEIDAAFEVYCRLRRRMIDETTELAAEAESTAS